MRRTAEKPRQHPFVLTARQWYVFGLLNIPSPVRAKIEAHVAGKPNAAEVTINAGIDGIASLVSLGASSPDKLTQTACYRLVLQLNAARLLSMVAEEEPEVDSDVTDAAARVRAMTGEEIDAMPRPGAKEESTTDERQMELFS